MHQYPGQDPNVFGKIPNLQLPFEQLEFEQLESPCSQRKRPLRPIRPPPSPEHQYTANDHDSGPPRKRPRTPVPCNDQIYCPPSASPNSEYLSASRVLAPCGLSQAPWPESQSHSFDPFASPALSRSTPSTPSTEASYGYNDTSSTFSPGNTISTSEQAPLTHTSTEYRSSWDIKANNTLVHYHSLNANEAITASQTTANFETLSLQSVNDFIPRHPKELEVDTLGHKRIQIDHQTICIGRITSGAIVCDSRQLSFHHQGACLPIFLSTDPTNSIDERLPFFLNPEPPAPSPVFGYLDERPSKIIKPLLHRKLVQIQALLDLNPTQGQQSNKNYPVYLNIYVSDTGVRVKGLGEFFVTNRVWLQHPVSPIPDIPYRNPHFLCRPGTILNTSRFSSLTQPESGGGNYLIDNGSATREDHTLVLTQEAKGDLEGLFDSLCQQSQVFGHIEQDFNISTPLLPHQKDAVYFMIQRERPQGFDKENSCFLWKRIPTPRRDGQYLYQNRITGKIQSCIPRQTLGGLLADHMGLGKTLSILSLIIHTLPNKLQNLEEPHQRFTFNEQQYSRTTLVITTKSVLPQWEQQVEQHIRPGALKSLSYFGSQRQISPGQIVSQDVVFTTYDIVSHEWRKSQQQTHQGNEMSTLHSIPWYRVVLDEAHNIRNRNTDRAKSIKELNAERRWCVTGTPIQNSMDDIAGLLLFLRFEPFDNYDTFRDYIRTPLERGDPTGVKALRTLIDSLTLRRVKGTVKLPQRTMYTKYVELRSHERKLYDKYLQQSKYFLDKAIITPGTCHAKTALEIILSLRLICDHGQDLLSSSVETCRDLMEEDIKAETQREIDADEIPNPITLYQELCFEPPQSAHSLSPSPDPQEDTVMLDRDAYEPIMGSNPYPEFHLTGVKDYASSPKCQPKFPDYNGPSSKVCALLSILQNPKEEWKHSNGPIKSVVFSVWTRMLDLVGIALSNQGIKFCRLDGSMSGVARDASIRQFNNDPETTVILVSLMAGGVGLNLTIASQVHLMEPHWNPMIEEQALERVHRIGQENDVQIFRYLVKDSFESSIIELQTKKLGVARLGMEKLTKEDLRVQKLKEIRALFN